jgi:hypothetical protein
MPYPLPSEHERRALFGWLKQASSLTAWRRLYTYHQAFLDVLRSVYEEEQRTPGVEQTVHTSWYVHVLQCHDAFAAALERLQKGDRRCFDFLGTRGHFSQGLQSVIWWEDMYGGYFDGRNGFDVAESPRWPEIEKAMHDCLGALSDIGVVLQKRYTDVPAPIREMPSHLKQSTSSLSKWWAAQTELPPVPSAVPELLVNTGRTVPCYGIWEPVVVTPQPGFFGALRRPLPPPAGGRPLDGCMNYLHGGSAAPTIGFEEDGQRQEGRPTTWRLLWRDQRYGGEPIPEKEQHYTFVQPVPGEVLFKYF